MAKHQRIIKIKVKGIKRVKKIIIKFPEWIAENHYRLHNVKDGVYYWGDEKNSLRTTKQLYKEFNKK